MKIGTFYEYITENFLCFKHALTTQKVIIRCFFVWPDLNKIFLNIYELYL